MKMVKQRT